MCCSVHDKGWYCGAERPNPVSIFDTRDFGQDVDGFDKLECHEQRTAIVNRTNRMHQQKYACIRSARLRIQATALFLNIR